MKNLSRFMSGIGVATLVLGFAVKGIAADDPVKVSPKNYKVLLENSRVRVIDIQIKAGEKVKMHTHPAKATLDYLLTSGKVELKLPDGKTVNFEGKAGDVLWDDVTLTHEGKNTGNTDFHIVEVEMKEPSRDPVKVAPNNYSVLSENDQIRVLEIRVKPREKVAMHSHPSSFVYNLSSYTRKFTFPDGKTDEREETAGSSIWSEAFAHAAENTGTSEIQVLAVEVKEQNPTSALKVAPQNTKHLFENDQVEVHKFWIKPGEKVAMHSHPAYVVYLEGPGKLLFSFPDGKTQEALIKGGEAIWSDPVTHAAENLGNTQVSGIVFELK